MGIVEDMTNFSKRYHEYENALEKLRQAKERHDSVSKIRPSNHYLSCPDKVVSDSRYTIDKASRQLKEAQNQLKMAETNWNLRIARLEKDDAAARHNFAESQNRDEGSRPSPASFAIFAIVALFLALFALGTWNYVLLPSQVSEYFQNTFLALCAPFVLMGFAVFFAGVDLVVATALFTMVFGAVLGLAVAVTVFGIPLGNYAAYLGHGLARLAAVLAAMSLCLYIRYRKKASQYDAAESEREVAAASARDKFEKEQAEKLEKAQRDKVNELALYNERVRALQALTNGELKAIEKTAKARANLLLAEEVDYSSKELEQANNHVESLRNEMLELVRNNPNHNLPEEEDWPAIDALCEMVRRGYADTRKEALLRCREESRHAELMARLTENYEGVQELRRDVNANLATIQNQQDRLAKTALQQASIMLESLGVQRATLSQEMLHSEQNTRMCYAQQQANELQLRQQTQLKEMNRKLNRINTCTTISAISDLFEK